MQRINQASIEFSITWQNSCANHNDRYFASKVDFWRDYFPDNIEQHISKLGEGEQYQKSFEAGVLVPPFDQHRITEFQNKHFQGTHGNTTIVPRRGRFYPQGIAFAALKCHRGNLLPFRIIKIDQDLLYVDLNYPLAKYPLTLKATNCEKLDSVQGHGGVSNDIKEKVTKNGPGMQVPYPEVATDFYSTYPFTRKNEDDDHNFYQTTRLANHLDDMAIKQVKSIYSTLLSSGNNLLDLMSSWVSHIPNTLTDCQVTGLGLNKEELKANKLLSNFIVHDLNKDPALPFTDNEFDAVICTASIEYLIQPIKVVAEIARVIKPGGIFVTTFSNRWFPGKEILPWSDMHHFERFGLVLDYFIKTEAFENLHTESVRGLLRPLDDRHIGKTKISDPIFAVWGNIKG